MLPQRAGRHRRIALVRRQSTRFLVPDEQVQQDAGQRQDRDSFETSGQVSYQRIFSPTLLGEFQIGRAHV